MIRQFTAAPGGHTIGVAAVPNGEHQATFLVLPKAWSPDGRAALVKPMQRRGEAPSILLYETDVLRLEAGDPATDLLDALTPNSTDPSLWESALFVESPSSAVGPEATGRTSVNDASVLHLISLLDRLGLIRVPSLTPLVGESIAPVLRALT